MFNYIVLSCACCLLLDEAFQDNGTTVLHPLLTYEENFTIHAKTVQGQLITSYKALGCLTVIRNFSYITRIVLISRFITDL